MKTQPSKFRVTQVLTCFAVFISAYTLGCFTIKRELFPYDLYKSWRKSGQQHESLPQKIEHYGDILGFGIEALPQQKLEQGDAAIILPKGELAFKYIGTIKIEEWLEHLK